MRPDDPNLPILILIAEVQATHIRPTEDVDAVAEAATLTRLREMAA